MSSRSHGVLAARNISKSYGDVTVLERFSLTVGAGSRVGVVGPNGIGKSTLLRLLAGVELPEEGLVSREPATLEVAYLAQEGPPGATVSGGEAARARLRTVIERDADVLLLDEPTNDLDAGALVALERFVFEEHRGGVVVVSHDRAFLAGMTSIIEFEAETRRVRTYPGGWSEFALARARGRERQASAWRGYEATRERIEEQARRMRQWEERGYGQGRKKKKTKDVAKAFERKLAQLEPEEKPYSPWRLELSLSSRWRGGDVVARLEQAVIDNHGFELGPIEFELRQGERLAILGDNGVGKSTLVEALLGELPLRSGRLWVGPSVVLGTIPQGPGPFADAGRTVLERFLADSSLSNQAARALLAKFGLTADHVRRRGASLSPGERTRATLALLVAQGVNGLILDEPTNHLDLEAIEQLESALAGYDGTAALVTHDRRFLEAFAPTRTITLEAAVARSTLA